MDLDPIEDNSNAEKYLTSITNKNDAKQNSLFCCR